MKKMILGVAIASIMSTGAYAEDFRIELNGIYAQSDSDGVDSDTVGLQGRLHFDEVDTSKGPLAEAAFLDKSSSAGLSLLRSDSDFGAFNIENDEVAVDLRLVTSSDWIVEAEFQDLDEEKVFGVGVGKYLTDNTDLVFKFNTFDEADIETYQLTSHTLVDLSGGTALAYDLTALYADGRFGSATSLNAGATYYFSSRFGLGAEVGFVNGEGEDTSRFAVEAEYFITPLMKASIAYESYGQDADGDGIALTLGARF